MDSEEVLTSSEGEEDEEEVPKKESKRGKAKATAKAKSKTSKPATKATKPDAHDDEELSGETSVWGDQEKQPAAVKEEEKQEEKDKARPKIEPLKTHASPFAPTLVTGDPC